MDNNNYRWILSNLDHKIGYEAVLLYMYDWINCDDKLSIGELEEVFIHLMRTYMDNDLLDTNSVNYYLFLAKNISYLFSLYSESEYDINILRMGIMKIIEEWIKNKKGGYNFSKFYYILEKC